MKSTLLLSVITALPSLVLPLSGGLSAEPAPPALEAEVTKAWQRRIPEIRADNLPLSAVADGLRQEFPEVNFIVPNHALDATVRITLRSVTLGDILKAIELASDGRIQATVAGMGQRQDPATGLLVPTASSDVRSNLVSFAFAGYVAESPPAPPACRVFSLVSYLAGLGENEVGAAVRSLHEAFEAALEMLKRVDKDVRSPELTIHLGTKLLIAVGREKELAVIDQIIKELQRAGPAASWPVPPKPDVNAKVVPPPPPPPPPPRPLPAPPRPLAPVVK